MFAGYAAEGPKRVLEILRQSQEAFPAEDHRRMLPAAIGQDEVIKAMVKCLTSDRHAQFVGIGEVRQGWDGKRGSASMGRAVRSLKPARAAAVRWVYLRRSVM